MTRKARKYCMNVTEAMACGVGSYGEALTFSMLNTFTITGDTTCVYPTLTTNQLQSLSTIDYDERVLAFLDYLDVGDNDIKDSLYDEATFDDPDCSNLFCLLNEHFLVYRFLDGFRVVNVGYANGVIQYKAYPEGDDPDNYSWQNSGTFINGIDMNLVYVIEVRDWYNNTEVCKVTQTKSLFSMTPSTTATLTPKLARLYEITHGVNLDSYGCYDFRTGCFQLDPSLGSGECLSISYTAIAQLLCSNNSIGCACVELTCKKSSCTSFEILSCLTNNDSSPVNNSFNMCYGDIICYNVYSCVGAGSYGTVSTASVRMTDVNGLSTILPTIDNSSCLSSVNASIPSLNIEVSFTNTVCTEPQPYFSAITGCINFNPVIPTGYFVDVEFSAVTETSGLGTSNISFYTGTTESQCIVVGDLYISSSCTQPQTPTLRVYGGQYAHYKASIGAESVGSSGSTSLCINDSVGSFGISPTISTTPANNCISAVIINEATPVQFSVCNQTRVPEETTGYINTDIPIPAGEYADISIGYAFELQSLPDYNYVEITLYRKPEGAASFLPEVSDDSFSCPEGGTFNIRYCSGDCYCYYMYVAAPEDEVGGEMTMDEILGSTSGIIASINQSAFKYLDFVSN